MFNNPLTLVDPTGMFSWRKTLTMAVGLALSIWSGGLAAGLWTTALTAGQIAAVMVVGSFAAGAIATNSLKGGLIGAFGALMSFGIASQFSGIQAVIAQAVSGGIVESLTGGNFGNGFLAAGLTAALMPGIGGIKNNIARTVAGALLGGAISKATGGKFINGAISGAVQGAMAKPTDSSDGSLTEGEHADFADQTRYESETALAWEPTLQDASNFAAGAGDTISLGLTKHIRGLWNIDGGVDYESDTYRHGGNAGVATSLGWGGGLVRGAVTIGKTVQVTRWGGEGAWYMVGGKSTSSWWLSGTRYRYGYNSARTMTVPAGKLSYPPGWEAIKGLWGQRVLKP